MFTSTFKKSDHFMDDDLSVSTSSSPSSSSSVTEPRKTFVKRPKERRSSFDIDDETLPEQSNPDFSRPPNPLSKNEIEYSFVDDELGNTNPEKKNIVGKLLPLTMLDSKNLEEELELEKEEFYRKLEEEEGDGLDYHRLNREIDIDHSPIRLSTDESKFRERLNNNGNYKSTPAHHRISTNLGKESISAQLDEELESESQKRGTVSSSSSSTSSLEQETAPVTLAKIKPKNNGDAGKKIDQKNKNSKSTVDEQNEKLSSSDPILDSRKPIIPNPRRNPGPSPVNPSLPSNEKDLQRQIDELKRDKQKLEEKFQSLQESRNTELRSIQKENDELKNELRTIEEKNDDLKKKISLLEQQCATSEKNNQITLDERKKLEEFEKLLEYSQNDNKKRYEEMREMERQQKQSKILMSEENDKLRQELLRMKSLVEQHQNTQIPVIDNSAKLVTTDQLEKLKIELWNLKQQLSHINQTASVGQNSNSFEQRRIKDLERQVKELEIIQRRNQHPSTSQLNDILNPLDERAELKMKLKNAEETLRVQDYQIRSLNDRLSQSLNRSGSMNDIDSNDRNPSIDKTNQSIDRQLHNVINRNKTITIQVQLKQENERLKAELEKIKTTKPLKSLKRDLETIKQLRSDLNRKNDDLEKLRALYDAACVQHKSLIAEREREKNRQSILGNKTYQPDRFIPTNEPIEVLQSENQQLKHLVDKLEQDSRQQHVELLRLREDQQATIKLALHEKDEEIIRLRQQHKNDLQKMLNEITRSSNDPQPSDLLKQIQSHELTIAQLKKSLERTEDKARELSVLKVHEEELQATIRRLERQLNDARTYQTPEMKHYYELQNQIHQLEQRWQKREKIGKDYATSLLKQRELDTSNDVYKLQMIIKEKDQEIQRFHLELDSMLKLLKTLKFQQLVNRS